jgi:uncharacterized protein YdhG (YjbR/CyaY superfamily)
MKKDTAVVVPRHVDEYLMALPEDQQQALEKIREAIKAAAPKAEEVISYQVPTYKYKGPLVHFAAFKNHLSLVVVSKSTTELFAKELAPFKSSGRTIHFTPEKPIPAALVKKIVKERVRENEAADKLKAESNTLKGKRKTAKA